jgi:hypothetical protein
MKLVAGEIKKQSSYKKLVHEDNVSIHSLIIIKLNFIADSF